MGKSDKEILREESERLQPVYTEYAKFYEMLENVDLRDITDDVLKSPYTKAAQKESIQTLNRRIVVFTYPSDGLKVKGLVSFVPEPQNHPLLVFLRGGNRIFGILNPGSDLVCFGNYTVIATMYRGGVSEGLDEFGGEDVNDVKNLMDFIPTLEKKLKLNFQNKKNYLLGASRGGMQMFLALTRFPELKKYFIKIVSLCGLLDLRQSIINRSDIEEMLREDFGLEKGKEEEWINKRDPLLAAQQMDPSLPILLIQSTEDNRVALQEGYQMLSQLKAAGKSVTYWEIEAADHCLANREDRVEIILKWLEGINDSNPFEL